MTPFLLSLTSLEKRLREDAERCLESMRSTPTYRAAYVRVQNARKQERGAE